MPSQLDLDGIRLLPTGSSITLHTASGDFDFSRVGMPNEVKTQKGDDAISLSENWTVAFMTAVGVPEDCISFSWSCDGFKRYMVHVVFIPLISLSDERRDELVPDYAQVCHVCGAPCDDPEDIVFADGYAQNCIVCRRGDLCDRCKVRVRGSFKCYFCLTEEEFVQAQEDYPLESLRLRLLVPPWPRPNDDYLSFCQSFWQDRAASERAAIRANLLRPLPGA